MNLLVQMRQFSVNFTNSLKSILPSLFSSWELIIFLQSSIPVPCLKPKLRRTLCSSFASINPSLFASNTRKASFNSSKLGSFSSNNPASSSGRSLSWSFSPSGLQKIPSLSITVSISSLHKLLSSTFTFWLSGLLGTSKSWLFLSAQSSVLQKKLNWDWKKDIDLEKNPWIIVTHKQITSNLNISSNIDDEKNGWIISGDDLSPIMYWILLIEVLHNYPQKALRAIWIWYGGWRRGVIFILDWD